MPYLQSPPEQILVQKNPVTGPHEGCRPQPDRTALLPSLSLTDTGTQGWVVHAGLGRQLSAGSGCMMVQTWQLSVITLPQLKF